MGGCHVHGCSSFIRGGLSSSMDRVVAAVPECCLLWALGHCWWASDHLVVGAQAVVHGQQLSLWVLGVCGHSGAMSCVVCHG